MNKSFTLLILLFTLVSKGFSQTTFTQWTYEPLNGTAANPTPNIGTGTSSLVGAMVGNGGTATGMSSTVGNGCGTQNGVTAWAINTAPPGSTNESSGAQFNTSTVGYTGINVSWDQRFSNTSTNTVRLQYTTDGSTWTNFTMTASNTTLCAGTINVNGCFENNAGDVYRRVVVNLSSITAANNNSNFGVRMLAAHYQNTGQFRQSGTPASVATVGTWRFDNVTFSGTPPNPTVNLTVSSNAGSEASATVITVTATASSAVTGNQTVSLGVSGTGITAGDYTLSGTTITILNGQTIGTTTFTVVDDVLVEGTETATLTISAPSAGITLGVTTTQNITITDDDIPPTPTVTLGVSSNAGSEANFTVVTATVTASAPVTGNQTVTLAVSGAGITASDYVLSSTTVTIPNGTTTGTAIFTVRNDAETEGTETAVLTISSPSVGITLGAPVVQNVAITDNVCQPLMRKSTATSANGAEISAFDSASKRVYTVAGSAIEFYTLSNTGSLSAPSNLPFGFTAGANTILPNSVAIKNGIVAVGYAIVTPVTLAQQFGIVAFYDAATATYINSVSVGYLPDMLIFTPDGTKVLTANEGEPNSYGQGSSFDPEGSVSIIDISGGVAAATVNTVGFTGFNGQIVALRAAGVRIYGPGATVAQDFEPEYIAFNADGSKAFVVLQENNAVAELDIATATFTQILPLGLKDHNLAGNGLDASDRDLEPGFTTGKINIQNWPIKGMYQPDAMASFTVGGTQYFITANEGDSRAYTGFNEEARVSTLTLDPTAFPTSATLQLNQNLGRLQLTNATGDTDNDGDFDELHALGARSFTIWNNSFTPVFDSKDTLERISAAQNPRGFNSDGTTASFDSRSDNKGPEPEAVATGMVNGVLYAFVGSERTGDIFVYDITNPTAPVFKQYLDHPADLQVEGVLFIPANQSPTGKALVIASAEVSRTVTVYEFSLIPNSLPTVFTSITANQQNTTSYGDCSGLIAKVTQSGATTISGSVTSTVWIESSVPTFNTVPFVERHYEITPASNAATATGFVTLYFTQTEFDNFNSDPASALDLPIGPADATGISNLRVIKYPGISNDGSGLPGSYTSTPVGINPADTNIVWNATDSRWEVTFDVTGFSGFFIQTNTAVLPLSLLSFTAKAQGNNTIVEWKSNNEINHNYYEVLYSTDGSNFIQAGQRNALVGSGEKVYTLTHQNASLVGSKLFYSLKMVSTTGVVTYSTIVIVRFGKQVQSITDVYPNPTTGIVTLIANTADQVQLNLIDVSGKIIASKQVFINSTYNLDLTNYANGIYILEATLPNGNKQQFKVVKK